MYLIRAMEQRCTSSGMRTMMWRPHIKSIDTRARKDGKPLRAEMSQRTLQHMVVLYVMCCERHAAQSYHLLICVDHQSSLGLGRCSTTTFLLCLYPELTPLQMTWACAHPSRLERWWGTVATLYSL